MAEYKPTAANIISSLGINGLTVDKSLPGYIPVLDDNGKLSAELIPDTGKLFAVKTLFNVAFIDPNTDVEDNRNGSITAPYKSITEAASDFSPTLNKIAFMLAPGVYSDTDVAFKNAPTSVYLIGLGEWKFRSGSIFTLTGLAGDKPAVFFQNISAATVKIVSKAAVTVIGKSYIESLLCGDNGSNSNLYIGADARVSSSNIDAISYLSEADNIGNTSVVKGTTVSDALNRLNGRKLRVVNVKTDNFGFDVDSASSFSDISVDTSGSFEYYDLRERDRILIEGINKLVSRGENLTVKTVTADKITAEIIDVNELRMKTLKLNGYQLTIDTYGYLVLLDGADTVPTIPNDAILLLDKQAGTIYALGVASGRLYVEETEGTSSDSVQESLKLNDTKTGYTYNVYISDGKVCIQKTGGVV